MPTAPHSPTTCPPKSPSTAPRRPPIRQPTTPLSRSRLPRLPAPPEVVPPPPRRCGRATGACSSSTTVRHTTNIDVAARTSEVSGQATILALSSHLLALAVKINSAIAFQAKAPLEQLFSASLP